jgi:hypothetical protein
MFKLPVVLDELVAPGAEDFQRAAQLGLDKDVVACFLTCLWNT